MVRLPLIVGEPAKCVLADKDGRFKVGDITWVNSLVHVPDSPRSKPKPYAMMQHAGGFVYLPAKHFVGLTEEELAAFNQQVEEIANKYEATN